ncbi:MAG: GAF domain-containing protein [Microcoleus sp. SM1_3_4]|nr:GAF domain-containing protein [Microcoleus sp. SM1_3_4]
MQHLPQSVTLNDICITQQLSARSPRSPNWQAEASAMQSLARLLAAGEPTTLQSLVEIAAQLCQAPSAGICLLETTDDRTEVFRWAVVTGNLGLDADRTVPRNFSPDGVCLDRAAPQLFSHPDRHFTYLQEFNAPIVECLVLPLMAGSQALGTIWIVSHDENRHFDSEDLRAIATLADFATVALQQQGQQLPVQNVRSQLEAIDRQRIAEERERSQEALRESQARLQSIANLVPDLLWDSEPDGSTNWYNFLFLEVNPAFVKQTGMEYPVGRKATELLGTPNPWAQVYGRVAETGEPIRFEEGEAALGRVFDLYVFRFGGEGSRRVAVLFTDITDRKQREEQQAFLLQFSDTLRTEPNADAVANRAIQMLIEQLQLDRSYITSYYLADNRADLNYQIGNDSVPPLPDRFFLSDFPEALEATFEGTLAIEDDWERQGLSEAEKRNSRNLGMRAMVAATLRKGENKPLWSMVAISSRPRRWTSAEIALVEEVAERTWAAVESAKAEQRLRESEAKYRSLFESIDEGYLLSEVIFDEKRRAD